MKTITLATFVATFILAAPALALAQNSGPQDKGSSGWTGGSQNPDDKGKGDSDKNAPAASHVYAEGLDLKGPPRQYPPGRPPE